MIPIRLSEHFTNETFTEDYVLHIFTVPVKAGEGWKRARDRLLEGAREASAPYLEATARHMETLARKHALPAAPAEPRVFLQVPAPDVLHLTVRIPVRARDKGRTEQEILERFYEPKGPASA